MNSPNGSRLHAGYNVGGADWPRPELKGDVDPAERLKVLEEVGFKEAMLVHQGGGDLLRTFIRLSSVGLFEPWFHEVCYAEKETIYQLGLEQVVERLDRVSECLVKADHAIGRGRNTAGDALQWDAFDAYFAGMNRFGRTIGEPNERVRILLTLVEHPPRLLIECPPRALLGSRSYSRDSLWEMYLRVVSGFLRLAVRRYALGTPESQTIGGPIVSAIEFVNEPDYTWLPDEQRIEHAANPRTCPCDKYLTELHLSQIPSNDLANKPVSPAPWGFQPQELDVPPVPETPVLEFRWGPKFDLYVRSFADLHERLSREVRDEAFSAGVPLTLVSGSVTHTNVDWLARMYRANPATFSHCDKIGIHPYHWPGHDIWDKSFVSGRDLSVWREAGPRRFGAEFCKRFDFLEQLTALVREADDAASFGLRGKAIWVTEFGVGSKKLGRANAGAKSHARLFIYPRGEVPPDGVAAECWEDIYDAFLDQVDAGYLRRHGVEAFLVYVLREGFTSHSSDECHGNFSIFRSSGKPRLAPPTHHRLVGLIRSLAGSQPIETLNTEHTSTHAVVLDEFPGITSTAERRWLFDFAAEDFRGEGEVVDLGSWLGSLTVPLLQGLARNPRPDCVRKPVHAYDLFIWQKWMDPYQQHSLIRGRYRQGDSFLPEFERIVRPWDIHKSLLIYAGDVCQIGWNGRPIELLVVDAMKSWILADQIVRDFFPSLIAGRSYVFHQDFCHFHEYWIHLIQYRLRNHFELAADLPASAGVVFRFVRAWEPTVLGQRFDDAAFPDDEVAAAFDYSLELVKDRAKHVMIHAAKAFAWLSRGQAERARRTIAEVVAAGLPFEGELKTVSEMIEVRTAAALEPGSTSERSTRDAAPDAGKSSSAVFLPTVVRSPDMPKPVAAPVAEQSPSVYEALSRVDEASLRAFLSGDASLVKTEDGAWVRWRGKLLPRIAGWRRAGKRLALRGAGEHSKALLGAVPELYPLLVLVLDRVPRDLFLGVPCRMPESFAAEQADVMVYSSRAFEGEMLRAMQHHAVEHVLLYAE